MESRRSSDAASVASSTTAGSAAEDKPVAVAVSAEDAARADALKEDGNRQFAGECGRT